MYLIEYALVSLRSESGNISEISLVNLYYKLIILRIPFILVWFP